MESPCPRRAPRVGQGRSADSWVGPIEPAVLSSGLTPYVALREKWRDWGDREGGQREFLVQDPDGYLVMVAQRLGERPLPA